MDASGILPIPAKKQPEEGAQFHRGIASLQLKFTLLVVGLALGVGGVVGTLTVDFASRLVNRVHNDQCRETGGLLADRAAAAYAARGSALDDLAHEVVKLESILFVAFLDVDGQLLAVEQGRKHVHQLRAIGGVTPAETIGTPLLVKGSGGDQSSYLDVTYPVTADVAENKGADLLGYIRLGFSLDQTFAEVSASFELLTGIGIAVVGLTVILGFLVVQHMVGPLCELSTIMSRFADGDLHARCNIKRKDEIGELAAVYNLMAQRLEHKHEEISELNAELESRVQRRTRQLHELASRDPLTKLYNRRHFNEVLERSFAEAKRYGTELACMMIDLDDFKAINDRFGHQAGDDVLVLTAMTVSTELRTSDVAARYGGDEFIILLPQTAAEQARRMAERLTHKFNQVVAEQFPACHAKVSVGVACMVDVTTEDPEDLIRVADKALYDAKKRGKNTIVTREVSA